MIRSFAESYSGDCRVVFNKVNSKNVFKQWQKGLELATGELIWICESDDTCDNDFLKQTVYLFEDPSIRLVFGDIEFMGADGNIINGMTHLRESAKSGIWNQVNECRQPLGFRGHSQFETSLPTLAAPFFVNRNLMPPLGIRRALSGWPVTVLVRDDRGWWADRLCSQRQGLFPAACGNMSVIAFEKISFYKELGRLHTILRERWNVSRETTFRFYSNLLETFERSNLASTTNLAKLVSLSKLIKIQKKSLHVAVGFLNFDVGGGEIFPIEMLNVLHRRGYLVSAVVQTMNANNDFVRTWLDRNIPVYVSDRSPADGRQLAAQAGFDIIHSHNIWLEFGLSNQRAESTNQIPCYFARFV